MTRCARRILFAVVAVIALAAFTPAVQAAPERSDMPVSYHDLRHAERLVNIRLRKECDEKVKNIEPAEISYRCGVPTTRCHGGDSVPWSPSTGICYGHIEAFTKTLGFHTLFGEVNVFFKKYLQNGEVVFKRLPWQGVIWSDET